MGLTPRIDKISENYIINGNFDFWQRNITNTLSAASSDKVYTADRWSHTNFFASGTATIARSTDVPSNVNATYSMSTTIATAVSVAHASNNYHFNAGVYRMEGNNSIKLVGQTITLQFWVKSNITGTYSIAFGANYDNVTSAKYVSTYTINSANTWEQKSITLNINSIVGSSFAVDNTQGMFVAFGIAANANGGRLTGTLNQWLATSGASIASTANRTDFIGTASNYIRISQVKLSIGSSIGDFSWCGRTYLDELTLCQRYYEKSYDLGTIPGTAGLSDAHAHRFSANSVGAMSCLKIQKRALPTVVWYSTSGTANNVRNVTTSADLPVVSEIVGVTAISWYQSSGTVNAGNYVYWHWTADSEL